VKKEKSMDKAYKNDRLEPPARTPEEQENRNISYANRLAEEQLRNKTARTPVIVHFLRMGSEKEKYERELLKKDIELQNAKIEAIKSQKKIEELYSDALRAIRSYNGDDINDEDEDEDDA